MSPFDVVLHPIAALEPHPHNPQQGDIGAVATAIAVDGWHGAIIAQAPVDGRDIPRIVAGHTRWRALQILQADGFTLRGKHLTYAQLAKKVALPPAGFAPVQILPLDDIAAARKMLSDNRASALSYADEAAQTALLTELATAGELLGSLFDGDDVDAMIEAIERSHAQVQPGASPAREVQAGLRSVILPMVAAEYDQFIGWLAFLREAWDFDSNVAVVARAVQEAVERAG